MVLGLEDQGMPLGFRSGEELARDAVVSVAVNAVGADLSSPIAQNTPVAALYVNAGSLSAERWKMNDGTISTGMARVLKVRS